MSISRGSAPRLNFMNPEPSETSRVTYVEESGQVFSILFFTSIQDVSHEAVLGHIILK